MAEQISIGAVNSLGESKKMVNRNDEPVRMILYLHRGR